MEDATANTVKSGTTTIALICKDGIIMAADRRATAGGMIVDKKAKKIHPIAKKTVLTTSGSVSDLQLLVKLITAELSLKRYRTELESTTEEAATPLASLVYSNVRNFSLIPGITHFLLGGHDSEGYHVYDIFVDGSISIIEDYDSSGSGSVFAMGVLEALYRPGMPAAAAVELVKKALTAALRRDSYSGEGFDIILITQDGIKELESKELKVDLS